MQAAGGAYGRIPLSLHAPYSWQFAGQERRLNRINNLVDRYTENADTVCYRAVTAQVAGALPAGNGFRLMRLQDGVMVMYWCVA